MELDLELIAERLQRTRQLDGQRAMQPPDPQRKLELVELEASQPAARSAGAQQALGHEPEAAVLGDTVVTPELGGTILAGVQRDSVITLLRDRGIRVDERRISINELVAAHRRGELREAFGTGTAATVSHVRSIRYREHHLVLPLLEQRTIGPEIRAALLAVATGRAPDPHGWVTRVGRRTGDSRP